MPAPSIPTGIDFTDPELLAHRLPIEEFAELRRTAPVHWIPQADGVSGYDTGGYWAITKLTDIKEISRKPDIFSSEENTAVIRMPSGTSRAEIEIQRSMLLNMDPPKHTKFRRIIAKSFTPRAMDSMRDALRERAQRIVNEAKESGGGDFVEQVASELPLQAIAELLGVPQEDRRKIFGWTNQMMGFEDPDFEGDHRMATAEVMGYAWNLAEDKRKSPMDDIVTSLLHADVEGESLASDEFAWFVVLLIVGGNETIRNAITLGMKAFVDNPDQWEIYKKHRPRTAPDEIVRWASPVLAIQRTAMQDTEIGGQAIAKGDRVGLFYASANFDEEHFENPYQFDVLRTNNPHVGFGGNGTHHCAGTNLARLQIDLMFNTIADVMPNLREISEPVRLRSSWLNAIKSWKVSYD